MRALVALALVGAIAAPASAQQASQLPVDAGLCSVAAGGVAADDLSHSNHMGSD